MIATFEDNPTLSFVVVYAPTEAASGDEKDTFYTELENTIR